jgi:hypothetical protein
VTRARRAILLAGSMAVGAGVAVAGVVPPGDFTIDPTSQMYGPVPVNTADTQTFTVTNYTSTTTGSAAYSLSGQGQFQFTIEPCSQPGQTCYGPPIPGMGSSVLVDVACTPSATGDHTAALTVTTQIGPDTAIATAQLMCAATPNGGGVLTILPTDWDFGQVAIGTTSTSHEFEIRNDTGENLSSLTLFISGPAHEFVGPPCGPGPSTSCSPPPPGNGSSTYVYVQCRPPTAAPPMPWSAPLNGSAMGSSGQNYSDQATLYCESVTGGGGPELGFNPSSMNLVAPVGGADTGILTITSEGDQMLGFTIVKSGTECARFSIDSCEGPAPSPPQCQLPPSGMGQSAQAINIVYMADDVDATDTDNCTLTIHSNDPDESAVNVDLTGVGTGAILDVQTASPIDFGQVALGVGASQFLYVHNAGNDTLIASVAASGAPFSVQEAGDQLIAPGDTYPFTVICDPAPPPDTHSGSFTVSSNGVGVATVPLDAMCEGIATDISFSSPSLDFMRVRVGRSSELTMTVTNLGGADIAYDPPIVAAPFTIVQPTVSGTIPGGSGQIGVTVQFAPSEEGPASGSVTALIPDEPTRSFAVMGTGTIADYTVAPAGTMDLGSTCVGATVTEEFTLTVAGSAELLVEQPAIRNGAAFAIQSFAPSTLPQLFDPMEVVTTTVVATAAAGLSTGTLVWATDRADPPAPQDETLVTMTLTGVESGLAASPGSIDYGEVATGESETRPITVRMCAAAPISVHAEIVGDDAFTLIGAPDAVAGAAPSEPWTVQFAPPHGGTYQAVLRLSPASGTPVEIPLIGRDPSPFGETNYYACGCNGATGGLGAGLVLLALIAGRRRRSGGARA